MQHAKILILKTSNQDELREFSPKTTANIWSVLLASTAR